MTMQPPGEPVRGAATQAETGRSCPYCRFPLKQGDEMVRCGSCSAAHHADCWTDNGNGCATVACPGGPSEATRAEAPPAAAAPQPWVPAAAPPPQPTVVAPAAAGPPPAAQMWQPPANGPRRTGPWVLAAAIVLALAVAGAAVAVVSTQKSDNDGSSQNASATPTVTEDEPPPVEDEPEDLPPVEEEPVDDNGVLPDLTEAEMEVEISDMLQGWHEDLVAGRYRDAFEKLTWRKRQQVHNEDGYAAWAEGQRSLGEFIDPSGLTATILDVDEETGEVLVDVTGMEYLNPRSNCSEWEGKTWVRWVDYEWLYEPGWSTTDEREAEWRPREDELLGIGC